MSMFNFFNSVINSVMRDDNGHPYRDDSGGHYPNNEYELDGTVYATDDNGSIYSADGKYYPNDDFQIGGTWFSTDDDGNLQD